MGRLPKIILMIAAMTAIFLWMSMAINSCGDKDSVIEDSMESIDEIVDDTEEFVDDVDDDDLFGGDDLFEDPEGYDESDFVDEDDAVEADFTDYSDDDDYVSTPSYANNSSGDYMVIAGNYLVESNARSMTRKLSNLGYPDSQIGIFDRSQYHTVIASRHDSYSAALKVSNAIKRKGVECYVKKKQY